MACGGLDNTVTLFDLKTKRDIVLGTHNGAVRCLEYNPMRNAVVSGGWDATVKVSLDRLGL